MKAYEHSGIVPVSGALMTLGAGSLAALLLGVVYTFAFYHILYVYLNVLFTFGFGAAVGWTVGFVAREGKIRNVPVVGGLALVAAFVGLYSAWGTTAYALVPSSELKQFWNDVGLFPFLPHNIAALMGKLYSVGSWGMTANAPVHGLPLVALWVIEAGIIGAMAIAMSVGQILELPFCEPCDEWVVARAEPHLFAGQGYEAAWSDVKHGAFESLAQTPRASGDETHYVRVTVSTCPKCDASNYLSVVACENRVNPKGGRYKVEQKLATNIPLTAAQVEIVDAAAFIAPAIGSEQLVSCQSVGSAAIEEPANRFPD
ncbi:MAG TPA: hypothetical protein VFB80_16415 [Pirellulaceae bacterium]|nr:hypothetical protein [Pirellulaceae bacterium]